MAHVAAPLCNLAKQFRSRPTVYNGFQVVDSLELHDRVAALSRSLSHDFLIQPGDRIVLVGLNTLHFFEAFLAITDSGGIVCPLNWRWTPKEAAEVLDIIRPSLLFHDPQFTKLACDAAAPSKICQALPMVILGHANGLSALTSTEQIISYRGHVPPAHLCSLHHQHHQQNEGSTQPPSKPQTPLQLQLLQPASDAALIVFTSGTTGTSKGAVLSHAALTHQSMAKLAVVGYCSDDVYLHMAPLFHIGGISSALAVLMAQATHVFMDRYSAATAVQLIRQHNVTALIAVPTMMADLVQKMHVEQQQQQQQRITGSAAPAPALLPTLLRILVGAGGMTAAVKASIADVCPNARLLSAYGMTEGASTITFLSLREPAWAAGLGAINLQQQQEQQQGQQQQQERQQQEKQQQQQERQQQEKQQQQQRERDQQQEPNVAGAGSKEALTTSTIVACSGKQQSSHGAVCVGWPAPGVAIKISTSAGSCSQEAGAFVVGEVLTRGPHLMAGYWGNTAATDQVAVVCQVLQPDGWLRTGDLGHLDQHGCLWLAGRAKDMIKSGGENVMAAELERVLATHPAVAAAAVVGVPHERLGEQVAAAVVLAQGWVWDAPGRPMAVGLAELQAHCWAAGLAAYKVPRQVLPLAELPTNSSGKVVKGLVRKALVTGVAAKGPGERMRSRL